MDERNYKTEIELIERDARLAAATNAAIDIEIYAQIDAMSISRDVVSVISPYLRQQAEGQTAYIRPLINSLRCQKPLRDFFCPISD